MNNWSAKFDSCVGCGTVEKKHMARGLCVYCYLKQYHNDPENADRVKQQKNQYYVKKQKPLAKQKREARYFDSKRELALTSAGFKCASCGVLGDSTSLTVHHKDGQGRGKANPNNLIDNLMVLCRACHLAEHRSEVLGARFKRGVDGWAKKYACCIDCGTTEIKHYSHGRCINCRARDIRNKKI